MALSPSVDHGPELSPAEESHDFSLPQSYTSKDAPHMATGLQVSQNSKDLYMDDISNTRTSDDRSRQRRRWLLGTITAIIVLVTIVILATALPLSLKHHRKKSRLDCSISVR